VLFGDPYDDFTAAGIPSGVAGLGGISSAGCCYTLSDGFSYGSTSEVDVVIAKNLNTSQATFVGVVTHELGHTLGFRHSNQTAANNPSQPCASPLPCSSTAIMNSSVANGLNTLQQYDRDALQTVYGNGPVCTPPSIAQDPSSVTINSGQSTQLSVTAAGSTPLTYQWYIGNPPNTSQTAANGTNATLTVSPTTTTTYWVRVTGQCAPTADSAAATVTVSTSCPAVTVPAPAQSSNPGGGALLTANPSGGSGFTFQWFQGATSGTGTPIGTGNPIAVNPSSTTSYWVRVTNGCGNSADSAITTVQVQQQCIAPSIVNQPQDQSTLAGTTVNLTVGFVGTNPTVNWFQGVPPDKSKPVGNGQTVQSPVLTDTTTFWAQLSNSCGTINTRGAVITVTQNCAAPAITSIGATPASVIAGQPTAVAVVATGTGITYQWFKGGSGDTTNPITGATGPSVTDTPLATTQYWVRVSSPCGAAAVDSVAVTVTVGACSNPTITTQPASQAIQPNTPVTLTVVANANGSGTLHYAWFIGASGNTAVPTGSDSDTLTTGPIPATTQFWVRVSNSCGDTASSTATVTVQQKGRRRSARH